MQAAVKFSLLSKFPIELPGMKEMEVAGFTFSAEVLAFVA